MIWMKYYAIDIETYEKMPNGKLKGILDTNKFVLGAIMDEKKQIKYFTNYKEMQKEILKIMDEGIRKREKVTFMAHNMQYEFVCV